MRGFSETNIKYMRLFYDAWEPYVNRQPLAGDLDWKEFLAISFSHHIEIISKVKDYDGRIFYIYISVQFMLGANLLCGITSGLIFIIIGVLCRITLM